ncbi:MAG TPA: FAD binding domain-containing protein [Bacteriovoracaceae bacterium]|nr:FAD binding domain-containing protein [Bacteriovoracaceae bacterium]
MTVADYLRYVKSLTGTKVVCAEGDCGACTILVSRTIDGELTPYQSINSCISFMYLLDRCHLITVEGLKKDDEFHPVQLAMVECGGAQCGYCTPGFICALASLTEDAIKQSFALEEKRVKNYLTGNLCRCTGYDSIIKAGCSVDLNQVTALDKMYDDAEIERVLKTFDGPVRIKFEDKETYLPATVEDAVKTKKESTTIRVSSGATDLGVLSNKNKIKLLEVLALTNIGSLYSITEDDEYLTVGARASLASVEKATSKLFPAFSNYLHVFASPQIKNSGTLIGNVINASPIADTVPFLRVAQAELVLRNSTRERTVNINAFFKGGYKEIDLQADELVTHIKIPKTELKFKLYKVSARRDLDISTVTFAAAYELDGQTLSAFSLALGGVGPTVLRMSSIEKLATGQIFDQKNFKDYAQKVNQMITPLSDVRGSADFRHLLCHNLLLKFCDEVMAENGFITSEISL